MRIAFFGLYGSFDYHHIGGTDSLVRRLAFELVRRGKQVDFVHFGAPKEEEMETTEGVRLRYYRAFQNALKALTGQYDHVITIYVIPKCRPAYARFRRQETNRTQFHFLFTAWPEWRPKRELLFLESRLMPYNGRLFCVSTRQHRYVSGWSDRATLLWPPVPSNYFVPLSAKVDSERVRVTFLGRVDPGKGVLETIELFNILNGYPDIELLFCGMHWPHDSDSVRIQRELLAQERFRYVHVGYDDASDVVEEMVRTVLRDTDILIQPYRRLSSTIDTPLLLLEGMASLAAVITKPYGDIPCIYGNSICLLDTPNVVKQAAEIVLSAREWLPKERERIDRQNKYLSFDLDSVAQTLGISLGIY